MLIDTFVILIISCTISLFLGGLLGASILYSYLTTELLLNPKLIRDHLDKISDEGIDE